MCCLIMQVTGAWTGLYAALDLIFCSISATHSTHALFFARTATVVGFCANKLSPPPLHVSFCLPPSYPRLPPPPPCSALTCCTTAIAEKHQQAVEQCSLGSDYTRTHTPARTHKHATKSLSMTPASARTRTHTRAHKGKKTSPQQTHQLGSCFSWGSCHKDTAAYAILCWKCCSK